MDLTVDLMEFIMYTGSEVKLGGVTSSGASLTSFLATTTILNPVVNNSLYTYGLYAQLPASVYNILIAVRVDYGYQVALPLVKK